ncbi:MAG: hypothetical protein ABJN40_18120 [Sneathiella sp.]
MGRTQISVDVLRAVAYAVFRDRSLSLEQYEEDYVPSVQSGMELHDMEDLLDQITKRLKDTSSDYEDLSLTRVDAQNLMQKSCNQICVYITDAIIKMLPASSSGQTRTTAISQKILQEQDKQSPDSITANGGEVS